MSLLAAMGAQMARAAGASYRYIRVYITANNGDAYTGFNELILRGTPGGNNYPAPPTNELTTPTGALTAASASSFYVDNPPAEAFDQNYTSTNSWYTNTGASLPAWIKYDFVTPVQVVEFVIIRAPDESIIASRWPKDFKLQGSNDNSAWTDLVTVTGETGWDVGTYQARVYSVPGA